MDTYIASCLDSIQFPNSFIHGRMEVIPLFSSIGEGPEYLTLGQALSHNRILITEVSKAGAVPELMVTNKGKIPILLIDGEEIAGAKQNRVLNTSILVPGMSEVIIPVSCTEHGRWSYSSPFFSDSRVMMDYKIRAKKMASVGMAMKFRESRASDQMEIWDEISYMSQKAKVKSPTGAMKDVFEAKAHALHEYLDAFPIQPGQQGVLVYLDNRPAGLDLLSRPEAYARIHEKLIRSYAMEALIDHEVPPLPPDQAERPKAFLQRVASCTDDSYAGVGLGTEHRLEGKDLIGSVLVHEGVVIHMACFTGHTGGSLHEHERMAGYRARRSSHASRGEGMHGSGPIEVHPEDNDVW